MMRALEIPALLLAALIAGLPAPAQAHDCPRGDTLIAGAGDYGPYNIVDGDNISGMDFEIVETILDKMGCKLEKVALPWSRHLTAIRTGVVDLATPVTRTPEREKFALFSIPYIMADEILFVRRDDLNAFKSPTDFFQQGKRLGVIRDFAYGGMFPELLASYGPQIERTDSQEQNLRQLELGRVDAILGEFYVISSVIQKLDLSKTIKPSDVVVASEWNYMMFSKKSVSQEFVAAFSSELRAMQDNGEIDRIAAQYRSPGDVVN